MAAWRHLLAGLRNLLHPRTRERELAEELAHFYSAAAEEGIREGLGPEAAQRRVQHHAGTPERAAEQVRSYGWEQIVLRAAADLRLALRQLRRHRTFTVAAVLTLALGIGANTAVFTVVERVLLVPLPYTHAARICTVHTHWAATGATSERVTGPDGLDLRGQTRVFSALGLYWGGELGITLGDRSVYTGVTLTNPGFFQVFSLQPVAGRLFHGDEAERAAVVSEQFAQHYLGGVHAALGRTLRVEDHEITITGVLPGVFHFPQGAEVWMAGPSVAPTESRTAFNYRTVALLQPAVSRKTAQAALDALSARLARSDPDAARGRDLQLLPLQIALAADARPTLLLLWATAGLMLLLACLNVAHLQLARAVERAREIAVRKALGASPLRILFPLLLESLLVSLGGAAAGALLAWPAVRILVAIAPADLPHASGIHIDGTVLGFSLVLAVLAAGASSVLPALRSMRVGASGALKQDTVRSLGAPGATRLRAGMVFTAMALTFVLTAGAALLLHTLLALGARDMGFHGGSLLIADVDVPAATAGQAQRAVRALDGVLASLRALPGVDDAAAIMGLPTGNYGSDGSYQTRGGLPFDPAHAPHADFSVASPRYFATMHIPLQGGREFSAADTATSAPVAIISAALARRSFGNTDPIGREIQCGLDTGAWMRIVGVVGNVRQGSAADAPGATLYMPMTQHPSHANQVNLAIRTAVAPLSLLPAVEQQLHSALPLAAARFTTMDVMEHQSLTAQHFRAVLLSVFAAAGLLLALLGVYSIVACTVGQRGPELALRMALGANRQRIALGVVLHAVRLALAGCVAGVILSLLLAPSLRSMLSGLSPADPLSLLGTAALLLCAAVAGAAIPARRALHINPASALRAE